MLHGATPEQAEPTLIDSQALLTGRSRTGLLVSKSPFVPIMRIMFIEVMSVHSYESVRL
jgi:hypothetical protein